jgi:flagellar hook-length control protein FliK
MNATSLSAADIGKTTTLSQGGAAGVQASDDGAESGGFLSVLGEVFAGEQAGSDAAQAVEAETEGVAGTDESLISEGVVKAAGELQVDAELMAALAEEEVVDELVSAAKVGADSSESTASQAMQEGSTLLGRLDEANQTLHPVSGNALPRTSAVTDNAHASPSRELLMQEPQLMARAGMEVLSDAEQEQAVNQAVLSKYITSGDKIAASSAPLTTESLLLSDTEAEAGQALAAAGQAVTDGELSGESVPLSDEAALTAPGQAIASTAGSESMASQGAAIAAELSADSAEQTNPAGDNQLVWGAVKTASAAGVSSALGQQVTDLPKPDSAVSAWQGGEALTPEQLTQLSEETGLTESQLLAAMPINWAVEPVLKGAEQAKAHTVTSVQGLSQQQLQQFQQAQHQQTMQTAQGAERIQTQQAHSSPELAAMVAQHTHQTVMPQAVKNAAATNGVLSSKALAAAGLGGAATTVGKKAQGESDLAQQLTSAAGQQGLQSTPARSELGQVTAQTPLQMVRDSAGDQLAERVQMMLSKNLRNVDIRLDPPELGRMQIRMSMNGDMASVQFTVNNPQAREMIEHAMPRLRDMLAQQGLQLADSSVHQQSSGEQRGYAAGDGNGHAGGSDGRTANEGGNLDESINLDVNIAAKDDGISYYA